MAEVPRHTSLVPLASPNFRLTLTGLETEGLLDFQERAGIASIVRWKLHRVIFGIEAARLGVENRLRLVYAVKTACIDSSRV